MNKNKIYQGDALETLKTFPDESVNCVMTSPPYWALRDYGTANWVGGNKKCDHKIPEGEYDPKRKYSSHEVRFNREKCYKCGAKRQDKQLGLEPTFEEYITKMCDVFDEVKRVLKKDGTCWVNYGDTYASTPTGSMGNQEGTDGVYKRKFKRNTVKGETTQRLKNYGVPAKSLTMIPFRFTIEMVNRGWILRNVIIWHKPNPMPSSAKDRFTVDFEYLFFFSKNKKYWFEQQMEDTKAKVIEPRMTKEIRQVASKNSKCKSFQTRTVSRNTRTVWRIPTKPFPEAHFAVYPEKLCIIPIKAGCPEFICKKCGKAREKIMKRDGDVKNAPTDYSKEFDKGKEVKEGHGFDGMGGGHKRQEWLDTHPLKLVGLTKCKCNAGFRKGIVLDPFMGAGTTAVVARKLGRNYVGIELNPKYIKMAEKRLQQRVLI